MALFPASPYVGARRVIDISGDGRNNRGRSSAEARDDAVRAGVTINGLPILAVEPDLEEFYRDNVIGGPGAFVIPAASFETFADAILKKLVIEISQTEPTTGTAVVGRNRRLPYCADPPSSGAIRWRYCTLCAAPTRSSHGNPRRD
jgi:Protein of unknown function (DUF1194)